MVGGAAARKASARSANNASGEMPPRSRMRATLHGAVAEDEVGGPHGRSGSASANRRRDIDVNARCPAEGYGLTPCRAGTLDRMRSMRNVTAPAASRGSAKST